MISRREFIAGSVALAVASSVSGKLLPETESIFVNDIHSQLNSTRVQKILKPRSLEDVQNIVRTARKDRKVLSVAGGRHAMGGQQFGTDALLIDIRFVSNVESFVLVDATGTAHRCSRTENPELFRLVHGGYGLFGIVTTVQLRLVPRRKVERVVEIRTVDDLMAAFDKRVSDGFQYGDFQFSIERDSEDFLHKGVFSCYRPVPMETPISSAQKQLSDENWRQLLYLAHTDKKRAFERYADYYLSTNGQVYWSDTHQLSVYPDNYHREIDEKLHAPYPATEIITEINVPRSTLKGFFDEVRDDFRKNKVELIYGTVRLTERDDESFLPWAKQPYACTIFNLHTVHSPEGLQRSADSFRSLIDMAARCGGTYYLTYHRYAARKQIESCYPQFAKFLQLKKKYDPEERLQSDWYRHYRTMFADSL